MVNTKINAKKNIKEQKHQLTLKQNPKIRPHRFGGEGVLIGGQTATLNA